MKLGIDARLLHSSTGIGRYTRSLFVEFARHPYQTDELYWLHDQPQAAPTTFLPPDFPDSRLPPQFHLCAARCKTRIVWTNWRVPPLLHQHDIDVYHGVCNFELPIRKVCRYVVTIHDLVPLFFPQLVPKKHLLFFRMFMKRAAHTADLIITDSEHSRRDIIAHLGVPAAKVRVVYLGYTPRERPPDDPEHRRAVLARYGIRAPYLLFVGVLEPKKNLERLLKAFALLRRDSTVGQNLQLVIAGGQGWFVERIFRDVRALGLDQQVIFPGFVPEADLPELYAGAEVFVFPSIYEGFGLPVVEAMSYGVPVVTSNISSLPELVGEAGVLVDPFTPEAICEGVATVLRDSQLRTAMRHKGRAQARQFSWQRTAEATYRIYQEAARL